MNVTEIANYLVECKLFVSPKISLLGSGESNINYLAEEGDKAYVIRLTRDDIPGSSRYDSEHHYLCFIEACGIRFAPRSVHYDALRDIHVVSYIDGQDASVADLDEDRTRLFIKQLKQLHDITYDDYLTWCQQSGESPRAPETLAQRTRINIDDRLQTIRQAVASSPFAREVIAWAEPKIEMLHAAREVAQLQTIFLHNDLRWTEYGGNLKIQGDRLYFIDWELAGFMADTAPEIGDVLGSIPNIRAHQAVLARLCQGYITDELNREQLDKSIRYGVLWGKVGNPLWAAERYFILGHDGRSDVERYRRMAESGMQDAERFFTAPFAEWFTYVN